MQHQRQAVKLYGTKSGAFAANIAEVLGQWRQPQPGG
jgi:hypothetical protein